MHEHYLPYLLSHDPKNITTEHEISAKNRLFNVDGIGVAWYTNAGSSFTVHANRPSHDPDNRDKANPSQPAPRSPALYRTPEPPLHNLNFRSICANTSTTTCFAHIRSATATATTSVNNHPFTFGRHAFMHNGFIADFLSIRRPLCDLLSLDAYAHIAGTTDSEHLAALYITYLTDGAGKEAWESESYSTTHMFDALRKAVETVIKLQQEVLGPEKAQPNDLNLATTDGVRLVSFRVRNHATEQPPSLYYSTSAGVTFNRKYPGMADGEKKENPRAWKKAEEHGRHVIVASEPSTYKKGEWKLLEKNLAVVVERDGRMKVQEVGVKKEWNATVNDA